MWSLDPKTWEWNKVYILLFSPPPPLPGIHRLYWWKDRSNVLSPLSHFLFPFKLVSAALYVADGFEPFDWIIMFDNNNHNYAKDVLNPLVY